MSSGDGDRHRPQHPPHPPASSSSALWALGHGEPGKKHMWRLPKAGRLPKAPPGMLPDASPALMQRHRVLGAAPTPFSSMPKGEKSNPGAPKPP